MSRSTHPPELTHGWQTSRRRSDVGILRMIAKSCAAWCRRQQAKAALESLSDRQLRDIGVARCEIAQLIRSAT